MRWIIILLAIALPVQADWYQFKPCGFGQDMEAEDDITSPEYILAPNLTHILWWIPRASVVRIVELRRGKGEMDCSWLAVGGDEWLVQGSAKEIYEYILKRRIEDLEIVE